MTTTGNALFLALGSLLGSTLLVAFGILGYILVSDVALAEAQIIMPDMLLLVD